LHKNNRLTSQSFFLVFFGAFAFCSRWKKSSDCFCFLVVIRQSFEKKCGKKHNKKEKRKKLTTCCDARYSDEIKSLLWLDAFVQRNNRSNLITSRLSTLLVQVCVSVCLHYYSTVVLFEVRVLVESNKKITLILVPFSHEA